MGRRSSYGNPGDARRIAGSAETSGCACIGLAPVSFAPKTIRFYARFTSCSSIGNKWPWNACSRSVATQRCGKLVGLLRESQVFLSHTAQSWGALAYQLDRHPFGLRLAWSLLLRVFLPADVYAQDDHALTTSYNHELNGFPSNPFATPSISRWQMLRGRRHPKLLSPPAVNLPLSPPFPSTV